MNFRHVFWRIARISRIRTRSAHLNSADQQKLRRSLITSLVIQGIGSFAPFLTIILLARYSGPATQGTFSAFKTWADLVSSLFVFGFPQAFIYLINKGIVERHHLLNISLLYAAATAILTVPLVMHSVAYDYNQVPSDRDLALYVAMISFGLGAIVLNRLIRTIYLTIDDGFLFSLITSAPAFFILVLMVAASQYENFSYDIAYFLAGMLTCIATGIWIWKIVVATPNYRFSIGFLPRKALASQSIHSFIQSICFTLQPVISIYFILYFGGSIVSVAEFTAATITIAAVNVLFAIIAPIFFNRWTSAMNGILLRRINKVADATTVIFFFIGLAVFPFYTFLVPLLFGPDYDSAIPAFQIVSLAVAPVAFTRIIASAIHAADRPDLNTVSCGVRLFLSVCLQLCFAQLWAMDPVIAAVWAWVGAEWGAGAYSWYKTRKLLTEAKWQ